MAGSVGPKILLAKPGGDDDTASHHHRSRVPWIGSLNLLSDWDFQFDRFLPFLTDNTDFTVVGVLGPPGLGKSTIMNLLYAFDASSPGMLPPFSVQSEDSRASAKHSTVGIEPRVSSDRFILLDTQPVFCPSVLAEMMRPDGSSAIPILSGESLSAELAHEIMNIQLGVFLTSVCHVLLVVSEGIHDRTMWRLMSTVDLLKHGIPDPSVLNPGSEKDSRDRVHEIGEYMAYPIFVHTRVHDQDLTAHNCDQLKRMVLCYFSTSSFMKDTHRNEAKERTQIEDLVSRAPTVFVIPIKNKDDLIGNQYESCTSMMWKLRDQILSMNHPSFSRTASERDWLKNSAKIWELVKNSAVIAEYGKTLQASGLFRR